MAQNEPKQAQNRGPGAKDPKMRAKKIMTYMTQHGMRGWGKNGDVTWHPGLDVEGGGVSRGLCSALCSRIERET